MQEINSNMTKVLGLVDIQGPSKRPASPTVDIPVAKRPVSRMPIHQEGRSPEVSVCNELFADFVIHVICI